VTGLDLFAPQPGRYLLWAAGALIELAAPALSSAAIRSVPFHVSHIPERYGALTIIVLGETVALVATGMASSRLHMAAAVTEPGERTRAATLRFTAFL
jgi:low temperature requirement protein LtrA